MRAIRVLLYAAAGIAALIVVALGVAVAVVDGAFVKARLERAMKEKNRTLAIDGTPKLTLFPVAGIALGRTTLSEPGSDRPFVALEAAEVAVRVMPLLSGEVALETLRVSGLRVALVRGKDGRMNFADFGGDREAGGTGGPPRIRIAGVNVERAQITYRDQATGQEVSVSDLALKAGRLDGDAPAPVSFAARIAGRKPELDLSARAAGAMRLDLARQAVGFDGFSAQLKGRADRDLVAAEIAAPKVDITPAKASGSAITGSVQLKGPQRSVDAKLRIAAVDGTAKALSIPSLVLDLAAAVGGSAVKAHAEAALKADLERGTASADLAAKLDESTIRGKLGLANFTPLAATFDL